MTDIIKGLPATASSTDTTSTMCQGGLCQPGQVNNDGNGATQDDLSFWQTVQDSTCQPQWLAIDLTQGGPYAFQSSFQIEYGTLGNLTSPSSSLSSVVINGNTNAQVNCTDSMIVDTGKAVRNSTCSFVNLGDVSSVQNINFTWNLEKIPPNNYCQMNVAEIAILGQVTPRSHISGGAIAGIVIGSLVFVFVVGLLVGRQINKAIRERATTMVERRVKKLQKSDDVVLVEHQPTV
jgi:hypothetical protein